MRLDMIQLAIDTKQNADLSQHVVPPQSRPWTEGLSTLRTAGRSLLLGLLVPGCFDAATAVAVSAGQSHWLLHNLHAQRTMKQLLLVHD